MDTERWRCFVAVPLGDGLRGELAAAVERWRQRADLDGLRWTDPASWHVTLAFIGSVEPAAIPRLVAAVSDAAAAHPPMRLGTGGVGGFPSGGRSRVAWYGVSDPDGELRSLAGDVRRAADADAGAPFRGHVTLARATGEPVDIRAWTREAGAPAGELVIERVELMRSHLGRSPARYETLAAVPVGAGAHV